MVEGGGEIVSAVARTKLTKSFRIRDGKFLVCAKSLDSIANLLGLGHAHRSRADLGNHADDAIITRSAIDGIHHIAQRLLFGDRKLRRWRLRHVLHKRLLEISFEN